MTLRLRDVDGRVVDVALEPRRPLTIGVELTGDIRYDVRRLVRADAIRRAAERHRAVARVVSATETAAAVAEAALAANCRPVVVEPVDPDIAVGGVRATIAATLPPDDGVALPALSGLELRHALIAADSADPAEVARWQRAVAEWAESPSKPMCAEYLERCSAAADDDVDTATLLAVLREVEQDRGLPPGSKFEMFAHLDALVGLDLAAEVGQPRR